jgi:lipase
MAIIDLGSRPEPAVWLERSGVQPSAENLAIAKEWLGFQPATTLRAMGSSITDVTGVPNYLEIVRKVFAMERAARISKDR